MAPLVQTVWTDRFSCGTVRELNDLSPQTPRQLLRSAFIGVPLPVGLLYQVVRRNRAEQGVTRQRAALIKLVLRSHERKGADKMISLDQENPEPAYRCGRLFAVLEEVQRLAVPGIKGNDRQPAFMRCRLLSAHLRIFASLTRSEAASRQVGTRPAGRVPRSPATVGRDHERPRMGFLACSPFEQQGLFHSAITTSVPLTVSRLDWRANVAGTSPLRQATIQNHLLNPMTCRSTADYRYPFSEECTFNS